MRLGVLVSGRGSNLAALLAAEAQQALAPGAVELIISNRPGVGALDIAAHAGKPALVIDHTRFAGDREAFEHAILAVLVEHRIDALILAGFMRVLTPGFIDRFRGPIVNTHPSLLPAFPGLDAVAQALRYGAKVAGVTVHFVDGGVDTGPIIAQRAVPVLPTDDTAALQHRIQREEHQLLPTVVRALAQGRITCEGRHVRVTPAENSDADQLL